jgi:hypothetical protein
VFDLTPEFGDDGARVNAVNGAIADGFHFASHQSSGQCGHCGTHVRYVALMTHSQSRDMIYIGETCLDNRFSELTAVEFHRLRKTSALNRERMAKSLRVMEMCTQYPGLAILTYPQALENYGTFVNDIADKLRVYGDLSDRQITAVLAAMVREDEWAAEKAAAPVEVKIPAPIGRQTVTGTVVKTEWRPNQWGGSLKFVVKDDRGFIVWSTVPASISDSVEKGSRVTFVANLERSERDPSFSFGKRPTAAAILTVAS